MNNFNDDKRILINLNDTVASRICERDGVGEPGTPQGVSQAGVARRIRGIHAQVYTIMFNLSLALLRTVWPIRECENLRTVPTIYTDNWRYE